MEAAGDVSNHIARVSTEIPFSSLFPEKLKPTAHPRTYFGHVKAGRRWNFPKHDASLKIPRFRIIAFGPHRKQLNKCR